MGASRMHFPAPAVFFVLKAKPVLLEKLNHGDNAGSLVAVHETMVSRQRNA